MTRTEKEEGPYDRYCEIGAAAAIPVHPGWILPGYLPGILVLERGKFQPANSRGASQKLRSQSEESQGEGSAFGACGDFRENHCKKLVGPGLVQ